MSNERSQLHITSEQVLIIIKFPFTRQALPKQGEVWSIHNKGVKPTQKLFLAS